MIKENSTTNPSAQAHRFETEQKQRAVTRALMRSAQVDTNNKLLPSDVRKFSYV